jgi:organic radical activating enzyme
MKKTETLTWDGYSVINIMSYNINDVKTKIRETDSKVALFGASNLARYALSALDNIGITVDIVCDSSTSKVGDLFCGYTISHVNDIKKNNNLFVFICSIFPGPMLSQLRAINVENAYSCIPLFEETDYLKIKINQAGLKQDKDHQDIHRDIEVYNNEFYKFKSKLNSKELKLRSIDIQVTEACSMKCIDCSNLMQYYLKPKGTELSVLFESIEKIVQSVDWVYEFRVLGGEPFMVKNLFEVINKLISVTNFGKIIIYTNGTIVPKNKNLECLKNNKVHIDISNYGEHSRNIDKLKEVFDDENINYSSKVPIWTDSGRILPFQQRTEPETIELFDNCCTNEVYTLLHGKLYRCPFSANADNLKAIPHNEKDFIDITNYDNNDELRNKLDDFQKKIKYLSACSFCKGRDYNTPKVEVAIQTKAPLPIPEISV